ncbi:hypothetical protein Nocox_05975 [Nonomuraea coxensis DSM 45129]|uniref:Secreted protein n=1 Tax=Nonomuraea coxensis DSM 45129 TaxID=1122611 RepID=A0ABX8TTZ6_9ACTN|nr:DUF5719 family protein [Nonomuraea coxensis]QYC38822.1 hypothetical protein Nocox_05975 [Nonomuraea coxensis DSM 45129]
MRTFVENRFGLLAVVTVVLAVLYGVAWITRPAPAAPAASAPRKVPVESVTAVCPGTKGEKVGVYLPGSLAYETMKSGAPYVTDGPGALEAGYTVRVAGGADRGLAGVRCTEPAPVTWLLGPGPADAAVVLRLANADKAPALVDVQVHAPEGPVSGDKGVGLEVAPGRQRVIDLRTLAPSAEIAAVSVTTILGRVAVSARAVLETGGVDWLPAAAPPATRVVVPGIPGGGGGRQLLVATPGETDAVVRVRAVGEDAEYAMRGRETLDVPAGGVVSADVTTGLGASSAALVLTSNVPIVAGAVMTGTGQRQDVAFTAGTPSLELGSAVARNGAGSRLVLTAVGAAAGRVRVQVVPGKGAAEPPFDVDVPAGRTRSVRLKARGDFAIVVTPVSGEVYGGRVLEERLKDGLMLTVQPLAPARVWTLLPPLTDTPRVVAP